MNRAIRNGIIVLLLIPVIYILAVVGFLPPYTLMPPVFLGLVFIISLFAIIIAQLGIFNHFMSRSKMLRKYADRDPTVFTRAVKDGVEGIEYLIRGPASSSFRNACLENWQFKNVNKRSSWMVVDEKGNDVTNAPLSRYDGVFTLVGRYVSQSSRNESEEYASIHDSVEYYD
ncbi:MAG: hypothetical protein ACFFDM_11990 [Candidatus Thorarchaeota archaeon]